MQTTYRNTPAGIIAVRGKRELHMLGTSVAQTQAARHLLATTSFDRLFKAARKSPGQKNSAYVKVEAH